MERKEEKNGKKAGGECIFGEKRDKTNSNTLFTLLFSCFTEKTVVTFATLQAAQIMLWMSSESESESGSSYERSDN